MLATRRRRKVTAWSTRRVQLDNVEREAATTPRPLAGAVHRARAVNAAYMTALAFRAH